MSTCWVHGWLLEWSLHTMGTLSAPAAAKSQADSVPHTVSQWALLKHGFHVSHEAQGPGKAVMLLLKHKFVFPYWAALNQEGIPWVGQCCAALIINAQSWQTSPCQVLHGSWNVFSIQVQDIKKSWVFQTRSNEMFQPCFTWFLLWVFLQKFTLFQTGLIFSSIFKISKKCIWKSEKGEGIFRNRKFLKLILSQKNSSHFTNRFFFSV